MSIITTENPSIVNSNYTGIVTPKHLAGYQLELWRWKQSWNRWSQLYELGFNLVPAIPLTKFPLMKFADLFDRRMTPSEFAALRADYYGLWTCNMLIVTGSTPGMKTVFLDPDDDAAEALFLSRCPESPMMTRTRRGCHRAYRHPETGYIPQQITATIDGVTYNIDRKADHNYVVAPGSIHQSGHLYDWVEPWTPQMLANLPIYDPSWLPNEKKMVTSPGADYEFVDFDHAAACSGDGLPELEDRIDMAKKYVRKVPGTTEGMGTASNRAIWLAGKIALGFLLPFDDAVEILMEEWADRSDQTPSWTEAQIRHKVADAIKTPDRYLGKVGDMVRTEWEVQQQELERLFRVAPQNTRGDAAEDPVDATEDQQPREPVEPPRREYDPRDYGATDERYREPPRKVVLQGWNEVCEIADNQKEDWVIPGWMEFGCLHLFTGLPFSGKSTIVGEQIASIARGSNFYGMDCAQVPFILLDLENKERILVKRIRSCLGDDPGRIADLFYRVPPKNITLPLENNFIAACVNELRSQIAGVEKGIIYIDTFRSAYAGHEDFDEVNSASMVKILKPLKDLAAETNWAIMVLHHNAKHSNSYSGTTAIAGVADYLWNWKSNKETLEGNLSVEGRDDFQQPLHFLYNPETRRNDLVGTVKEVKDKVKVAEKEETQWRFLKHFPDDPARGTTAEDVAKLAVCTPVYANKTAKKQFDLGMLSRVGTGMKGSPYLYHLTEAGQDFVFRLRFALGG